MAQATKVQERGSERVKLATHCENLKSADSVCIIGGGVEDGTLYRAARHEKTD